MSNFFWYLGMFLLAAIPAGFITGSAHSYLQGRFGMFPCEKPDDHDATLVGFVTGVVSFVATWIMVYQEAPYAMGIGIFGVPVACLTFLAFCFWAPNATTNFFSMCARINKYFRALGERHKSVALAPAVELVSALDLVSFELRTASALLTEDADTRNDLLKKLSDEAVAKNIDMSGVIASVYTRRRLEAEIK